MESMTGKRLDENHRARLIDGPSEQELVIAALEETMTRSYTHIHDFWKEHKLPDLRTAAFLYAIERVAESYKQHGIFP
jgi:glutamate dehydrogenase (NAD(P)+)